MEDIQVIAGRHHFKQKQHKHKHRRKPEHPKGHVSLADFTENGWAWLLCGLLLIAGIVFMILFWIVPHPVVLSSLKRMENNTMRSRNPRLIPHQQVVRRGRTACLVGETFDTELQMCAPTFYSPLAFDGSIMDTAQPSCGSFYRSMCGRWIDQHTNENRAFSYGYHKNQERIRKLVTSPPLLVPSALNKFYSSCITFEQHAKESILELKHTIEIVLGDVRSHSDLPNAFGRLAKLGYTAPWTFSIERHPLYPRMIPFITIDSFPASLDEGRIYQILHHYNDVTNYDILQMQQRITSVLKIIRTLKAHDTEPMSEITDYIEYVTDSIPGGRKFSDDLVRFETLPQQWNLKSHSTVPGWTNYFQALDGQGLRLSHDQEVWVIGKSYMRWLLSAGLASFDISDWKAFIEFSIVYNGVQFEPDLPNDVYFKQHDKRGPIGPGGRLYQRVPRANTSHIQTAEERCVRTAQHMVPGLVAKAFLDTYFLDKENVRQDVIKIVDHIKAAFIQRISVTKWLSDIDKANITAKMQATLVRVIEPNDWEIEPFAERMEADRYDHNMNLIRKYRVQRNLALWHKDDPDSFDRSAISFFAMPLTETNAYYSGPTNTITILAGILQPPFYSTLYNQVTKHAILGSIVGHEMTHMLDNHGLYWDDTGSLRAKGWLTEEGMRAFYDKADCVIVEYGPFVEGCEDANVAYGNSTVGEDLADLTGIALAYDAYFKYTDAGVNAPLSDKQHFFMGKLGFPY